MLALIGILIRNSVILIVQIEHLRKDGRSAWEAVVEATEHRMRPIMLTAAAASLGLIPIAREIFWGPMAYAMMGGIIVGTLLTLLFLPALYVTWFRIKEPEETELPTSHVSPTASTGELMAGIASTRESFDRTAPQMAAEYLRDALNQMQQRIILLDEFLNAQFMNKAVRKLWSGGNRPNKKPPYAELVSNSRRTGAYGVPKEQLDRFIEDRIAIVRASRLQDPMDARHGDGRIIRSQCTVLPSGGRMLSTTTSMTWWLRQLRKLRSECLAWEL